jgi:hypothetical protein
VAEPVLIGQCAQALCSKRACGLVRFDDKCASCRGPVVVPSGIALEYESVALFAFLSMA